MKNVLVLGCARSGTSILGELFDHLPEYRALEFEPDVQWLSRFARPCAVKNPALFRPTEEEAIAVRSPGLPFELGAVRQELDDPDALWIVRHPLDAVASLRPGLADFWGHGPPPPDFPALFERPVIERCAAQWDWVNGAGFRSACVLRVMLVYYEDLVAQPVGTAARVCAFLGYRSLPRGAVEWAATVSDDVTHHQARHQSRWATADHARRVGRWRENLTDFEAMAAARLTQATAAFFGYDAPWAVYDELRNYGKPEPV